MFLLRRIPIGEQELGTKPWSGSKASYSPLGALRKRDIVSNIELLLPRLFKAVFGDRIQRMTDFVRMWLILRALYEQEERQVEREPLAAEMYRMNKRPYVNSHDFAVAISNLSLIPFWLPLSARRRIFKRDIRERGGTKPNQKKLHGIYSLLEEAEDYLENPKANKNIEATEDQLAGEIRVSSKKSRATFITSYWGGLNRLLTTNKMSWSFLGLVLAPQWIPLLIGMLCKYTPLLGVCHP
jgi:hypothetical protein